MNTAGTASFFTIFSQNGHPAYTLLLYGSAMKSTVLPSLCLFAGLIWLASAAAPAKAQPILSGAGATFPHPLYERWIHSYSQKAPVRVTYRGTGSADGIQDLLQRKIDFGATDVSLSDREMQEAAAPILHLPTCVGAVAVIYNLEGDPDLRLTPDLLADIFLGRIPSWDHPRLRALNPSVDLPSLEIMVVHRAEGSGTNYILSDYLSKVSPHWNRERGVGKTVAWNTGLGVRGNSGVASMVKKIPGAIGYVSLNYAVGNRLPVVRVKNAGNRFVKPTVESATEAASISMPADWRRPITNTEAPEGYPISGFTYLIFYQEQSYSGRTKEKARALASFLWWCVHEGQRECAPLHYAPLPETVSIQCRKILRSMTFAGSPLIPQAEP